MTEIIIIEDACVIIDLINIGLLDCQLIPNLKILTTDFVIDEITQEDQKIALSNSKFISQIEIKSFEEDELIELLDFETKNSSVSIQDNSALLVAIKQKGILLTSDSKLKSIAKEKYKIKAHGILWQDFAITVKYLLNLASRAYEIFESSKVEEKRPLINFALWNLTLTRGKLH